MQRRFSLVVLLVSLILILMRPGAVAQIQQNAPATAGSTTPPVSESDVPPDGAVITIHGLCGNVFLPGSKQDSGGSQSSGGASDASAQLTTPNPKCETVITRQQFESLIKGINPKIDPRLARSFAAGYPETLMFARKAVEIGLDKDPAYQAVLQFKYQQALYSIFKSYVKQGANAMSDAELEKFYNEHRSRYEQFGLLRIHVPNTKEHNPAPGSSDPPKSDAASDQAAMKSLAIKIRAQAVAGGNFEKLQAYAYKVAGVTEDPPDTDLGDKWTRDTFPAEYQSAVFSLKPGQVSQPIHNDSGWHIIKLVSRSTVPWSEARDMTLQLIVADQANATRKAINAEINKQYFVSGETNNATDPLK